MSDPRLDHGPQQIDWHTSGQVVNVSRAVGFDVWPKPIGENGHWALLFMVMRLLDLHRAVQEARRVITEMLRKGFPSRCCKHRM